MSMLTMRQALERRGTAIARWASSAMIFLLASGAVLDVIRTPSPIVVRPASEAVTTPVFASSAHAVVPSSTLAAAPPAAASSALAWDLANIANPRVDAWVRRFTSSFKGDISAALARGKTYAPMISAKLAARGMPRELLYLPLIESNYKPTARSRVAAVGLWQFMAGTARTFGLSVGRHVDERKDPARETDAALSYLSQLHSRFGSWYLAAAAYNAGPGAVANALHRVLGRSTGSDEDFYRISGHLPAETRDYVPKLIAAARIAKDLGHYGLSG